MSVTTSTELWRMSVSELAAAIRVKQVSSQDVIEVHLHWIADVNPAIGDDGGDDAVTEAATAAAS